MWSKTIEEVKQILSSLLSKRKKARLNLSKLNEEIKDLKTELQQRNPKWWYLIMKARNN